MDSSQNNTTFLHYLINKLLTVEFTNHSFNHDYYTQSEVEKFLSDMRESIRSEIRHQQQLQKEIIND